MLPEKQFAFAPPWAGSTAAAADEDRERAVESGPESAASADAGPCPSITGLHNSQVIDPDEQASEEPAPPVVESDAVWPAVSRSSECSDHVDLIDGAVVAIDWLELGRLIAWDDDAGQNLRWNLDELQQEAKASKGPQPYVMAGREVLVHPYGFGKDSDSRMTHRIDFDGVLLAFAFRQGDRRNTANCYLKVPGFSCVVHGALAMRDAAAQMIGELGGEIQDDWVRRIDVCLDLPGLDLNEWIVPAYLARRFKSTAKFWRPADGPGGVNQIEIGTRKYRRLIIYDKLKQVSTQPELYRLAMIQNRWGGEMPAAATRLEYSVSRNWLYGFGLQTMDEVLRRLPDVIACLARTSNRPFFYVTDRVPDRKNGHQTRCGPDPEWLRIAVMFQYMAGSPQEPLTRIERGLIKSERATRSAVGFLTSAAANSGASLTTVEDLKRFLGELAEGNGITDEDVYASWKKKAHSAGTFREPGEFPFGANEKGGQS